MNAHEQIVSAVRDRLALAPAVAGLVERGRRRPVSLGVDTAVLVYFGGSQPQRSTIKGARIEWVTAVRFECLAVERGGVSGDQAALALHAAAWNRLFADPLLGGLVQDMEPGPIAPVDAEDFDASIGLLAGTVYLRHPTSENTLEA